MYPYLFQPILKEVVWGGTDIRPFKGMAPTQEKIGESWELSHVDGDFSVVANGADKGCAATTRTKAIWIISAKSCANAALPICPA